jgi:hypothetical protein
MVEFDNLPPTSRSLILATLALDIVSRNCRSIFDLALRRNQTVNDVWRDICRRTAQPHCTMPRRILESQYTGTLFPAAATVSPAAEPAPASASPSVEARPERLPARTPTASVIELGDLIAIQTAERPPKPAPPPIRAPVSTRRDTVPKWQFMIAAGAAAMVLMVAGFAIVIAIPDSVQTTAVRLDAPVIAKAAQSDAAAGTVGLRSRADAVSVPVPEGTLRRLDAISKGFSKQ